MKRSNTTAGRADGYVLFEVILALTIFAIAVVGLATALNNTIESSATMNLDNSVRIGLRSFIEEIRRKPLADMSATTIDEQLGATYSSTVETINIRGGDGTVLTDLYTLHAKAAYGEGNKAREEIVDLYVYKPATEGNGR
ncbi:MAG: hypothetical protein WCN98_21085 [Verrucomicrobiaceae bacterium]